eukprot:5830263-Pyramimonas_sp.AAC.2
MHRYVLEPVSLVRSVAARSASVNAPPFVRRRIRCVELFPIVARTIPTRAMSTSAVDSREYPQVPRIGVGVVLLRTNKVTNNAEVLLIQRGKEPDKGKWTFPGGRTRAGGDYRGLCRKRGIRGDRAGNQVGIRH